MLWRLLPAAIMFFAASMTSGAAATTGQKQPQPYLAKLSGPQRVIAAQICLARQLLSPGSVDGLIGPKTRAALKVFQQRENLPLTGEPDDVTLSRLLSDEPLFCNYVITTNDLARLRPATKTWLSKSLQDRLDYETIIELVGERCAANPNLIVRLNPDVNWTNVAPGLSLKVPKIDLPAVPPRAGFLRIYLGDRALEALDESTNVIAHFPCSIARQAEKRLGGELHVIKAAENPSYTFDPEIFPESAEGRELGRKLLIPPGPNNPVGTVWIGLDAPGYGIHGTPRPEEVGRAETHGCFRLANWNAELLVKMVTIGTPVFIVP